MDFSILLDNVRPIGQGFLSKGKCTLLSEKASTSPLHKEMDAYRAEIQSKILNMLGSKAAHNESKFICKAALISECSTHSPSVLDKRDVLIPLLCDQDVLCSLQYGATFSVVAREADGEYEASPRPKETKRTRKHCPGKAYRPTGVMFCFHTPGSSTGTQMI